MTTYFFENPWPLFFTMLVATSLAAAWFWHTRRPRDLAVAVGCLLLAMAPLVLDFIVVTPAEQIDCLLDRLVLAALSGDTEEIVAAISHDYQHGGWDHAGLSALVRSELGSFQIDSLRLNGRRIQAGNTVATASFVAVASGSYRSFQVNYYAMRFLLALEYGREGWKIYRIQRFDPVDPNREIELQRH